MNEQRAIAALSALAQETRLKIFRYLVEMGSQGAPAGQIGEHLKVPWPTLSFHLKTLQHSGLLERKRESRCVIYSAKFTAMEALMSYLTENCCQGHPETCGLTVQSPKANASANDTIVKRKRAGTP